MSRGKRERERLRRARARRRFALIACFAVSLAFVAVGRARGQGGFGIPPADSSFVDSLRSAYRDSLRLAASDTSRADSLLAIAIRIVLRDSISVVGGDTTGVSLLAEHRVVQFTGADSAYIRDVLGMGAGGEGFHPTIKIGFADERDSRSLTQSVQQLSFKIGDRLDVTTGVNTSQRRSKSFQQRTSAQSSNTHAEYALTDLVSIISDLQVSRNRNELARGGTRTLTNDNFQTGTAVKKTFGDSTQVSVDLTGGTTGQRNVKFTTRGASGELHGTISMVPAPWLHANSDYKGSRSRQHSKNLDQGFSTNDRVSDDNLNSNVSLALPWGTQLALMYTRSMEDQERPDTLAAGGAVDTTVTGRQETRTERVSGFGLNLDAKPTTTLSFHAETNLGDRLTDFAIQRNAYTRIKNHDRKVSVSYTMPTKTQLDASLAEQFSRNTYRPGPGMLNRAGDTHFRALNSSLKQPLGSRFTLETRADVQLQSYSYDDKVGYDQDRDGLDQKYSVKGDYRAKSYLQLTCEFAVRNSKSLYIQPTKSSQNTNTDDYSLRPAITFILTPRITVTQQYALDATYTEYTFDDSKNTVFRIATLTTAFNYDLTRRVGLSFTHSYRDQDSGKLLRSSSGVREFNRQTKTERQELNVGVTYTARALLNFKVNERVLLDRSWSYQNGIRIPGGHEMNEYLTGEVNGRYVIQNKLQLTYKAAMNLGNGRQVPVHPIDQRHYATASLDLSYTY